MAENAARKLVVGLGNPGRKYAGTRHNVGFEVLGLLARRYGGGVPRARFRGEVCELSVAGSQVLLLCPHTYMNRSGSSVLEARDFYKLEPDQLLVICDDINLPLGRLRIRAQGSSGGQKGLQDIFRCLGTDSLARLRVGIGAPPASWDAADYVLSRFAADELPVIALTLERAADAAADWVREDTQFCMNRYNADPAAPG